MIDVVWEQLLPLTRPGQDTPEVRAALDASMERYRRFYAEVEALAHSSINAVKPRKGAAGAAKRTQPPAGFAKRVARKVPKRYRRLVPVKMRRRLLGSR